MTNLHSQLAHKLTKKRFVHYDTINNYEVMNAIEGGNGFKKR